MHGGFAALRDHCPMNTRRPSKARALTPEVAEDVKRIEAIWADSRARFGQSGPFLLGAFCAADAMYAPVVSRFASYVIPVGAPARAYMQTLMALPAWKEWATAAAVEPWVMPQNEHD
jgi:glutathione S-transferase